MLIYSVKSENFGLTTLHLTYDFDNNLKFHTLAHDFTTSLVTLHPDLQLYILTHNFTQ